MSAATDYSFYVIAKDASAAKGTTVQLSATATSSAGINRVEFYVKGSLVCSDSAPAYICSWKAPGNAGTYSVEARAFDNAGNQMSSIKSLLVN